MEPQGLFDAAVMGMPPTGTLFEGVSQLPGGHYLVAGPGGVQVCRYSVIPSEARDLLDNCPEPR